MTMSTFLQTRLGQPYEECDCWDITKLFYKEVLCIDLSLQLDYGTPRNDESYRKKISNIVEIQKCKFIEVDTPIFGDIILFNIMGLPAHIGVYIGDGKFVHSIRETGCCVETTNKWKRKVRGYYRWPEQD